MLKFLAKAALWLAVRALLALLLLAAEIAVHLGAVGAVAYLTAVIALTIFALSALTAPVIRE